MIMIFFWYFGIYPSEDSSPPMPKQRCLYYCTTPTAYYAEKNELQLSGRLSVRGRDASKVMLVDGVAWLMLFSVFHAAKVAFSLSMMRMKTESFEKYLQF
ncbi:unnamed protein product [Orchesella dallaii]|uniref:Uncharacterized protein n=1 Tax=Orchesella dallaii TaxID=48710 RepID=A0ABP1PNV4_9HEXA